MKKRILGTILAAVLVVSQAVTAFAAGSRTTEVTTVGDSAAWYKVTGTERENFSYLEEKDPELLDLIMDINKGRRSLGDLGRRVPEIAEELNGKTMVTKFFDVAAINGGKPLADGRHQCTFSIPELTRAMVNVKFLHYSAERNVWEVITPSAIDYENKLITIELQDLGVVAVIADIDESKLTGDNGTSLGTSPKTGVMSQWGIYMAGAAVLLAAAAILLAQGRKRSA